MSRIESYGTHTMVCPCAPERFRQRRDCQFCFGTGYLDYTLKLDYGSELYPWRAQVDRIGFDLTGVGVSKQMAKARMLEQVKALLNGAERAQTKG